MGKLLNTQEALNKNYLIKSKPNGSNGYSGYLTLPKCLMGKRVNLRLVS